VPDPTVTFGVDADVVVRILAAAVLGGAIGVEREATEQPAGFRTHIALAMGAALFGVASTVGFDEFVDVTGTTLSVDPTRVASTVATGIGFLGAGVIFRRGNSIRNLTTAASLWAVGAVGLLCGLGDVGIAAVGTLVLLASLVVLRPVRSMVRRQAGEQRSIVRVTIAADADPEQVADALRHEEGAQVVGITPMKEDGRVVLLCTVRADQEALDRWCWSVAPRPDVVGLAEG
jgi:putative Mg2+ transporter-C (MgtC) family protein